MMFKVIGSPPTGVYWIAVFFARIVIPFSRSRSIESMTRSWMSPWSSWCFDQAPVWANMASTKVVLP